MRTFRPDSRAITRRAQAQAAPPHCLQLLLACNQTGVGGRRGSVIAFTSANPGEGVSHVVRSFASEIANYTGKRTVIAGARRLRQLHIADYMRMNRICLRTDAPNLWVLPSEDTEADDPFPTVEKWEDDPEFGLDRLQAMRSSFDFTLIDCPSIKSSFDAAVLAPNVDGVVLVVEADRTKREQIRQAQQTIEMADGKLLGLVMNKRRYVVPRWLYRLL